MNSKHMRFCAGTLILAAIACPVFGQSKYAKIKDGVGNILVGEVLPYNDDEGYKNVVIDSVKLSQMAKWGNFYFRAYLGSKIGDINHDIRVLAFHIEGVGKRAEQFNREAGGNFILTVEQKDDPEGYGERAEWSIQYPDFNAPTNKLLKRLGVQDGARKMTLESYLKSYDYRQPSTFEYRRMQSDIGDVIVFSPETFKEWKNKYGLTSLAITLDAYSFVNGGETSVGENKTVLTTNSDGELEEKEELASVKTSTLWVDKKHLAAGKFTIVLD